MRWNVSLPVTLDVSEVTFNGQLRFDYRAELAGMRYCIDSSGGNGRFGSAKAARIAGQKAIRKWARTMRDLRG